MIEAEKWAADTDQLLAECQSLLGRELTSYVGGGRNPCHAVRWLDVNHSTAVLARDRLEIALKIAGLIPGRQGAARMRSWLRDRHDELDGLRAATVLRESQDRQRWHQVRGLAEAYARSDHS
ncbi:hypothetical protein Ade02nite_27960 [Paractinoplanes deccanensis]|uniref:Uncharacterized protein n=1 Tax=Paractinoplanes deccanensis TaxID=113561 RepID=A0ABQ3Y2E8_9ACTN|nr:hypothetical protein [Actinoplanes deccanensis]GID74155.1 hypothetical protein Ade02nite_27960 [Actinoplanes deccanensis]